MCIGFLIVNKKLDFQLSSLQELVEEIMYKNLVPMATGDESINRILGTPSLLELLYTSFRHRQNGYMRP